ncbi:putative EAL-domain containing protein YkuI [Clostridium homopropionicum DSM 5847]|uniref:Putative EAL-domain containing protein YkuI n=1 Tax=Clostridium homopropionicum DSM 5847 TaxID=1121318 RepID=A0A0L6ZAJ7_9CLOT|nr:EAL domain-containing protein [Clostridium homopropionicum]KOA20001.1 putative EAL-domain containing protein YkuI [Clostridium homopropionicum DSM 5847]SFG64411.1 EAL domain, c-di-GMP-specific phosphodiesterase class I (or its enzymatically inactive variant) [Clostridium homopropionicum]
MRESRLYEINEIKEIIDNERIIPYYQPIISLAKNKIVGFEGLSRGVSILDGSLISPIKIFEYAHKYGLEINLDRLCREKCIEGFNKLDFHNKDVHLFVNIDASIIEQGRGSNYLFQQVLSHGVSPENIVIEINESHVKDINVLVEFVKKYRKEGFLIALDDLGAGFSNFERILLLEPDVIKLDITLIKDVDKSYYKQEIFKCLVKLANHIGAIVVAEGVETQEELNCAIEYGAHLIQGYFFSKPLNLSEESISNIDFRIKSASIQYKSYMSLKVKKERISKRKIDSLLNHIISEFERADINEFDNLLLNFVEINKDLNLNMECVYILDDKGIQVSDTVFSSITKDNPRKGLIFYPSVKGEDNSLKKYYYDLINSKTNKYTSSPYISHATGSVCRTISRIFKHENNKYILCVDLIHKL